MAQIEFVMLKGEEVLFKYTLKNVLLSGLSQSFSVSSDSGRVRPSISSIILLLL